MNPWQEQRQCCNGVDVVIGGETYNITNVYNRDGVRNVRKMLNEKWEKELNKKCIVLGDWNARLGGLGHRGEENAMSIRPTMDTEQNTEGEEMLELLQDCGFSVLNGNKEGDWEGLITHVGYRSKSVIDYGAANELAWDDIINFSVGNNTESDHFPLEVTLRGKFEEPKPPPPQFRCALNVSNCRHYQSQLEMATTHCVNWNELAI